MYRASAKKRHPGRRMLGRPPIPDPAKVHVLLTQQLKDVIDSERRSNERYTDTILRMIQERTNTIGELRKKVDALQEHLSVSELPFTQRG